MDVETVAEDRHLQEEVLVIEWVEVGTWVEIAVVAVWVEEVGTLADVEVVAGHALETNTPDRFTAAVVAWHVFVPHILIYIISQLEKTTFVLSDDAASTEIVVGFAFGLESLETWTQRISAFITLQP